MKIKTVMIKNAVSIFVLINLISCSGQHQINADIESPATANDVRLIEQFSGDTAHDFIDKITELESQLQVLNDEISKLESRVYWNNSYEMFYGEWAATEHIYVDPVPLRGFYYSEKELEEQKSATYESIKACTVQFTRENIVIDGDEIIENIKYNYTVFPADNDYRLHFTITLKDIGLVEEGNHYFVYVEVETSSDKPLWCDRFFIKDKNTLVFYKGDYCMEFSRISYEGGSEKPSIIIG